MQRFADLAPAAVPQIWSLLSQIPDPEIPVLTITDLGMVRSVTPQGEGPGCPGASAPVRHQPTSRTQLPCASACRGDLSTLCQHPHHFDQ